MDFTYPYRRDPTRLEQSDDSQNTLENGTDQAWRSQIWRPTCVAATSSIQEIRGEALEAF